MTKEKWIVVLEIEICDGNGVKCSDWKGDDVAGVTRDAIEEASFMEKDSNPKCVSIQARRA